MVARFLERFQLWRQERAEQRQDNSIGWLLFLAFVVVAQDTYSLITTHYLTWRAIVGSTLILSFVVLHIRQSRWTWIVLMVLALVALAQAPLAYASVPPPTPTSVRFLTAGFGVAVGIAALVYSLIIRKRFSRGTLNHLTNR
jgi:hypothetical protein